MKFDCRQFRLGLADRYPCACCGYLSMQSQPGIGNFEVCPICHWEDDRAQFEDVRSSGGANQSSLIEARRSFEMVTSTSTGTEMHPVAREMPRYDWMNDECGLSRLWSKIGAVCACCGHARADELDPVCSYCMWERCGYGERDPHLPSPANNGANLDAARIMMKKIGPLGVRLLVCRRGASLEHILQMTQSQIQEELREAGLDADYA